MTELTTPDGKVEATVREDWGSGGIVDMRFEARVPVGRWEIEIDAGGAIVTIWNAEIVARDGTRYTLGGLDYNDVLAAGGVAEFGFQVEGRVAPRPIAVDVAPAEPPAPTAAISAASDAVSEVGPPAPEPPAAPAGAALGSRAPVATGESIGPGAERLAPTRQTLRDGADAPALTVTGSTVPEPPGAPGAAASEPFAAGPLSTRGATIVDAGGAPVRLQGINWFGLETEISAPHGLWARNWREIMDDIRDLGFNTLRVPFSGALVEADGGTPSGIDFALNPDLAGLDGLAILDAVVRYADRIGLKVILDYHRSEPGGGPNDNGLWYGSGDTETDVVRNWQTMAERYRDAPAVIGADLFNEPHGGTWGDGAATDWAAAAERIGAAVQAIAPDWLIVVEGIAVYRGDPYWWGGNLQGVAERPVRLPVEGKLVYSPHDYPASVYPQPWFTDGTDLADKFRQNWGFIAEEGIAPVLIGEWGSRLETAEDLRWARALSGYIEAHDIDWLWWSLNPNSGDTGGLFADDWETLRQPVVQLLGPLIDAPHTAPTEAALGEATFTISFDRPVRSDVQLKYATVDGTAEAGTDYLPRAGTLDFSAGEQTKTVVVPILPDAEAEGDEFFYLILAGDGVARGSATAVIVDDGKRRAASLPFVDVASTIVSTDATAARFAIVLSERAPGDVAIAFTTRDEDGPGRPATSARVVIPRGESGTTLEVSVPEGTSDAEARRLSLSLTAADGARIRTGEASALVVGAAPGAAEVNLASATGETQFTIDLIMANDWGSGALYNVALKNLSATPVAAWQVSLDLPFDLAELWSAVLVADDGGRVTVRNAEWNGVVEPGETVGFGFISDAGGIPIADLLGTADIELAIR